MVNADGGIGKRIEFDTHFAGFLTGRALRPDLQGASSAPGKCQFFDQLALEK